MEVQIRKKEKVIFFGANIKFFVRLEASSTLTPLPTPTKDTMHLISFVFLALTAVTAVTADSGVTAVTAVTTAAEGQYPCVTTNAANGNCTALTDDNINDAVSDTINNPSYALAEWGDISDW